MTSRGRRDNRRTTTHTAAPLSIPPYEPPTYPLNDAGQRALVQIERIHSLSKLKRHLETATTNLTDVAAEINDNHVRREEAHKRRKARHEAQGIEADADEEDERERERDLDAVRQRVESMTAEMEHETRNVIDAQAALESMEAVLKQVSQNAVRTALDVQSARATRDSRRSRLEDEDGQEDQEEGDEGEEEGRENEELVKKVEENAPSKLWDEICGVREKEYHEMSLSSRYATNNFYIGFKRVVHDARNPGEDAPPLPNPSTWFAESSSTHPNNSSSSSSTARRSGTSGPEPRGKRQRQRQQIVEEKEAEDEDEDEDDVAIAREVISVKCPLTQQIFRDPVTSKKCPHSFEREAITSMIRQSNLFVGGGGVVSAAGRRGPPRDGKRVVKCPVCEQMLSADDFFSDQLLIRRIKRRIHLQTHEDNSDDDDDDDEDTRTGKNVKRETHSQSAHNNADDSFAGEDISVLETQYHDQDEDQDEGDSHIQAQSQAQAQAQRERARRIKSEGASAGAGAGARDPSLIPGTQFGE